MSRKLSFRVAFLLVCFALLCGEGRGVVAQVSPGTPVTAALLSDPHFDPFRDPAKVKELAAAGVDEWNGIFERAASPDAASAYAALQKTCNEKLDDADRSLELSAFDSAASAHPAFVLVAGDMLVHAFTCRYRTLLDPAGTDAEGEAAFAAKSLEYQLRELHRRFPETPFHLALGNNDTDCDDYALDEQSGLLKAVLPDLRSGWVGVSPKERRQAQQDFLRFGSYAVSLPASVHNAKLIVLDDLYLSSDYKGTCRKGTNTASATALLRWLETQLAEAKRQQQSVWVLAHIPPEVNVYRTYLHPHDICHGQPPEMFFKNPAFSDLLVRYSGTVRVFLSGHTHIDEIHLIESFEGKGGVVPLKTIPSVSPVSTNPPAYLLAKVDPSSATMLDYTMETASGVKGSDLHWSTAYDFRTDYHTPAFTAEAVAAMLNRWSTEPAKSQAEINEYQSHVAHGLRRLAFSVSWPQQLCAMQHSSAEGFVTCACSAKGGLLPPTQDAK